MKSNTERPKSASDSIADKFGQESQSEIRSDLALAMFLAHVLMLFRSTRLESRNEIISDVSLARFLAHFLVYL